VAQDHELERHHSDGDDDKPAGLHDNDKMLKGFEDEERKGLLGADVLEEDDSGKDKDIAG